MGELARRWRFVFEPHSDRIVGELGAVTNQCPTNRSVGDISVGRDIELYHHRQTILTLPERSEIGGELVGEHREDRHAGVDGGGIGRRVCIGGGANLNERLDVSDADPYADGIVGQQFREFDLVEIARLTIVDG